MFHVVIDAEAMPERVMNDLKSYARVRHLNAIGLDSPDRKRWAGMGHSMAARP